jgi:hypothetical protein
MMSIGGFVCTAASAGFVFLFLCAFVIFQSSNLPMLFAVIIFAVAAAPAATAQVT